MSSCIVVCGANWGDEGKGRIVDYLASNASAVIRFQGGNNAGHTVVNEFGTFKLHLIPSGIFYPNVLNILGTGTVIDLEALNVEMAGLRERGFKDLNLRISNRATICLPFYPREDALEEERLGSRSFGSTKRGIAPAYADRYWKRGTQIADALNPDLLRDRITQLVELKNAYYPALYPAMPKIEVDEIIEWVLRNIEPVKDLVVDMQDIEPALTAADKPILFEAQLGALRDINAGIYPYTSSSCCLSAYAPLGGGFPSLVPDTIVAVAKAFSTCVGDGPFVTEMEGAYADQLREVAMEYGVATGRPRRIGHFDAVATRYGAWAQRATTIALTKLDTLSGLSTLKICTHYQHNGNAIDTFPPNAVLSDCKPIYKELPGWNEDISGIRKYEDLPENTRAYIEEIERLIGTKAKYISVGAHRDAMIVR